MLAVLVEIVALAALVTGVAMVSVPAAFIVAGTLVILAVERW